MGAFALWLCNCGNRPRCSIVAGTGSSTHLKRACGLSPGSRSLVWRLDRQRNVRQLGLARHQPTIAPFEPTFHARGG